MISMVQVKKENKKGKAFRALPPAKKGCGLILQGRWNAPVRLFFSLSSCRRLINMPPCDAKFSESRIFAKDFDKPSESSRYGNELQPEESRHSPSTVFQR